MLESNAAAGPKRWLTRLNVAAAASVAVGGAMGLTGGMLAALGPSNYMNSGFLEGMVEALMAAAVLFYTGAFLGAGVPWALNDAETDYSPGLMALGAFLGAGVGAVVAGPLEVVLHLGGAHLIALAAAFGGARLAGKVQRPKTARAAFRWARLVGVALVGLGVAAWVAWPKDTFPGASAPIAERRAWAVKTFDAPYVKAEEYLRKTPVVAQRVGTVEAIAPTEGPNQTAYSPGELSGEFTLEVKGSKGEAIAHLRFMHGTSDPDVKAYGFSGELRGPVGTVTLPELK